jgi:hypothetical protein
MLGMGVIHSQEYFINNQVFAINYALGLGVRNLEK